MPQRFDLAITRRVLLAVMAAAALAPGRALAQPMTYRLKVGVIGAGRLGGSVGTQLAKAGYPVMFSSRHPDELKGLIEAAGPNATAGTVAEAAAFGDVVLIAVPYAALPAVGRDNAAALKGKVVLNASNPVYPRDGEVAKAAQDKGVGYADAEHLPGTRLVRAFNSVGARIFATEGHRQGEAIGVPLASDDADALKVAEQMVRDIGFEPVSVPLGRANEFAPGGPLFPKALPVSALRTALGIAR